ncbi:glycosyl hydrolase family 76-domain-containing protein [Lophiotrema nucula]|uniref:mannan endo-1,6-alpha-mannosidase n=1 Tax=Lophiotrema nucula TaxID=690887 RepID=A0A6A5Z9Y3_9PLEO|nr:glycosyl hydrolase family 76-domain-containing protein [Lophiotrema nucula]
MRFFSFLGAVLLPFASFAAGIEFNPDDEASLRSVTASYAYGLMTYYKNNATGLPAEEIGIFPKPHYWWEAGAAWGGLIEYTQFTGDHAYVNTLTQALVSNYGPNSDILLPWRKDQEGNDDQAFWAFAFMSALEYQFPDPTQSAPATYLQVVENAFNNLVSRWDTTTCNGGLKWQIYPENAYGYNYKNSISNGAVFALGARLAQYTGNQTYADWSIKIFDWSKSVGLISDSYEVFDGTDNNKNCTDQDHTQWSYNVGVYLHGAAALYNFTNGDEIWKKHTTGLFDHASYFFKPYDNATNIMFEAPCETGETGRKCNLDQQSFKAYLSRFIAKTAILAPFTREKATTYLRTSAIAAAKSCTGPQNACGSKWYTGGWDGTSGVGQQLSALEVTQALLMLKQNRVCATGGDAKPSPSSTVSVASSTLSAIFSLTSSATSSEVALTSSSAATVPTGALTSIISAPVKATDTPATPSKPDDGGEKPGSSAAPASSASSSGVPGVFAPVNSVNRGSSTCTPSSTTTVYVRPTSAPVANTPSTSCTPSSTVTVYVPATFAAPNGTVPVQPPASSTTGPALFTGVAVVTKVTGSSVFGAIALAVLGGLV